MRRTRRKRKGEGGGGCARGRGGTRACAKERVSDRLPEHAGELVGPAVIIIRTGTVQLGALPPCSFSQMCGLWRIHFLYPCLLEKNISGVEATIVFMEDLEDSRATHKLQRRDVQWLAIFHPLTRSAAARGTHVLHAHVQAGVHRRGFLRLACTFAQTNARMHGARAHTQICARARAHSHIQQACFRLDVPQRTRAHTQSSAHAARVLPSHLRAWRHDDTKRNLLHLVLLPSKYLCSSSCAF